MQSRCARWIPWALSALLLGPVGCSDGAPGIGQLAPPRESPAQLAGSETCAQCHPSQVDSWSRNPMARSLEPTLLGELDGLGSVMDGPAGYSYRFTRQPDGSAEILGEERLDDSQHALGYEVLFAVGAGIRDRSYVLGHGAGMWFAPVEVITREAGREAVLAPHAAMKPGSRAGVAVTSECLGCHTDALPAVGFPLNLRHSASDWTPRGISCGACHGNAQGHGDWQMNTPAAQAGDPLVTHAQLDREQQLSICAGCHLQGDTRLVLDGPDLGPPKPGGDLVDSRAHFVAREATQEVGFVSQVERLVLSQCYLQSEMTCTACHDPHRSLAEGQERDRVRAACLNCHGGPVLGPDSGAPDRNEPSAAHTLKSAVSCSRPAAKQREPWPAWAIQAERRGDPDCVACHMPRTGVFDVARVTIHDHFIRRQPSQVRAPYADAQLRALESASADWKRFSWPGRDPGWGEDAGIWFMAYASKGFSPQALAQLDKPAGPRALAIPMYHHLRAGMLRDLGRLEEAKDAYLRALELNPALVESAINLGLLWGELDQVGRGLMLLDEVVARHPAAWTALRNRAVLRSQLGDLSGAVADLQRAFELLPSAEVALALSKLHRGRANHAAAQRWSLIAVELEPKLRASRSLGQ